ncbi:AAA family ATPase [Allorhodopirellula heiligendammensis]|uniref:ATPase family associated with various cellular activities (AAA) n=1 Tax=Allorhodopirellula heiligendammensis TaxID=2714739 RepID=A0A5C6BJ53_9BACT|nr:AAA family ATPase [Allorhodopirellula heiligendammensis]TWU10464.1 ATPase family associated with various cellular activities (AAA) [Allorhodopirellula heiligendammensis]
MSASRDSILKISAAMNAAIIGQETVVERLLIALLTGGNVLMEGLPGTAKTRSIKTLSRLIEGEFSRVQFTPDLLPSDVTGSEIYREKTATFEFQPGPIFGNLVLADEINRAPAKVQAALLEAMEEHQVTVAGTTHKLPELFLVLATQNPIEQEGTYPLPEAQMDRFLLYVQVPYPAAENELSILQLVRRESVAETPAVLDPILQETIFAIRKEIDSMHVAPAAEQYMVDLVVATRDPIRYDKELASLIQLGASPRGTIALDRASRARAWLQGHDFVSPADIQAIAPACLAHRVHLSYEAEAAGKSREDVIGEVIQRVAVTA